jgi:putative exosortase-associated protein (TIGR04073 family)
MFSNRCSPRVIALGLLAVTAGLSGCASSRPAEAGTKGPFYEQAPYEKKVRKFTRGFLNVFLSPAEIPNQAFLEARRTSPFSGGVVGAGKGVVKGAQRVMIGFWEMATFYAPMKNNYQPYIEPEIVFMADDR